MECTTEIMKRMSEIPKRTNEFMERTTGITERTNEIMERTNDILWNGRRAGRNETQRIETNRNETKRNRSTARAHHDGGAEAAPARARGGAQARGDVPGVGGGGGVGAASQPPRRSPPAEDLRRASSGCRPHAHTGEECVSFFLVSFFFSLAVFCFPYVFARCLLGWKP